MGVVFYLTVAEVPTLFIILLFALFYLWPLFSQFQHLIPLLGALPSCSRLGVALHGALLDSFFQHSFSLHSTRLLCRHCTAAGRPIMVSFRSFCFLFVACTRASNSQAVPWAAPACARFLVFVHPSTVASLQCTVRPRYVPLSTRSAFVAASYQVDLLPARMPHKYVPIDIFVTANMPDGEIEWINHLRAQCQFS